MPTTVEIEDLLEQTFGTHGWQVSRAAEGWSETSFAARLRRTRVFVKCDVPVAALVRLAEMGVTPTVLASGAIGGRSFVIQRYVAASYPERRWFLDHLEEVARLIVVYQEDAILRSILESGHRLYLGNDRSEVDSSYSTLREAFPHFGDLPRAYERFVSQWPQTPQRLVPTHGDLSRKNFLLHRKHTYVVDWDAVALADPMRDVAPFLWWYIPPERWKELFSIHGAVEDSELLPRCHWWVARTSLDVALGLLLHEYAETAVDFLEDFAAAVDHRGNPHAWWGP